VTKWTAWKCIFRRKFKAKLNRLAAQQGRNAESLVHEAVERLVDYDEWFRAELKKGRLLRTGASSLIMKISAGQSIAAIPANAASAIDLRPWCFCENEIALSSR
jgi:hypothetical protein